MAKRGENGKTADGNADLEHEIHAGLASIGWLPPETEEDVARAEAELAEAAQPVPDKLRDPDATWNHASKSASMVLRLPGFADDSPAAEDMARAARGGRRLAPEVEDLMRRDRDAAEQELDDEEAGPCT